MELIRFQSNSCPYLALVDCNWELPIELHCSSITASTLRELPAFFVYAPRRVSFFYSPNCINAPQKVNHKKMHPAAFYFSCPYTNGITLRIIIKDYIITQSLINETALNIPL